jgi:hypothetical protein
MKLLPGWELIIYHGNINKHLFAGFDCEQHTVHVTTLRHYNSLITDPLFWNQLVRFERVLVFQNDSMILRDGIDEFLEYNYVGAPWKFQHKGGNGGFSLRNPKAMLKLCKEKPYSERFGYEDVYFSNHIENVAPRNVCEKFSVETIFKLGTFAYHAIDNWLTKSECEQIRHQYESDN